MGRRRRPPARLVKVAYYSPFPPERSGIADYSALLFPALQQRLDVVGRPTGCEEAATWNGRLPLPRREQPRRARLDRRRASPQAGCRRPPRLRPPSPRRRDDARARRSPTATSTRCTATPGGREAARARRRRPSSCRRSGRSARRTSRSPERRPRPRRRADLPLALRRGAGAGSTATTGRSRVLPMPAWPPVESPATRRLVPEGDAPVLDLRRVPERGQACPAAARGIRPSPRAIPRCPLVLAGSAGGRRAARLAEPWRGRPAARPPGGGRALAASRRFRRLRQPSLADDGRDLGNGDPRALRRHAARRERRRLVLGASGRRRREGPGRRAGGGDAGGDARAACGGRRPARAGWAPPPPSTRGRSTTSTELRISTSPRSRRVRAGTSVQDAVLHDVATAAQARSAST